ncbi:MAG: C26 family cysteine hydrolase domain-containing family, partial [Clostridiales bacterium]|nr:C26 family cysteine hydrolase domain-containing family [Clostridiales bacterium]
ARENNVPYFGICLGMQVAVIDIARNILGLKDANSIEFAQTDHPVIDIMPGRELEEDGIGSMRLGLHPCELKAGSRVRDIYGDSLIHERHRHRYELNNDYKDDLIGAGLEVSGTSPDETLVEVVELKEHPWFVGVQFHPEFKSRPNRPHPLFADFVRAAIEKRYKV